VEWQKRNKEKARIRSERWRDHHFPNRVIGGIKAAPEEIRINRRRDSRKKWVENNKEKMAECRMRWNEKNKTKVLCKTRAYQAAKRHAVPLWADLEDIEKIYAIARQMSEQTGIKYEVDHIIPLVSDVVCGLHCSRNLRIIPMLENRLKGNRLIAVDENTVGFRGDLITV